MWGSTEASVTYLLGDSRFLGGILFFWKCMWPKGIIKMDAQSHEIPARRVFVMT